MLDVIAWSEAAGLEEGLQPMDLDAFKSSGVLKIWTPNQAIGRFRAMRARIPVEHVPMMYPAGLPAARFIDYARLFAEEVMPAFG